MSSPTFSIPYKKLFSKGSFVSLPSFYYIPIFHESPHSSSYTSSSPVPQAQGLPCVMDEEEQYFKDSNVEDSIISFALGFEKSV